MSIGVIDRKMLWGRSGGKCAKCKVQLLRITELGHSSILGEEAHIVAREHDGPRGDSPLDDKQRDSYSNLILLCPTHHSEIDKVPAGVAEFPVEKLQEMKRTHEEEIAQSGQLDSASQVEAEQWSFIIDQLEDRARWDEWKLLTAPVFSGRPALSAAFHEQLQDLTEWIHTRRWPSNHLQLRKAIESFNDVLITFLRTFELHAESQRGGEYYVIEKFYKTPNYDHQLYHRLLKEYKEHVALTQDLLLEVTRYGNYIANVVQECLDSTFRFEAGVLTVRPDDLLTWELLRPEFRESEIADWPPFKSLDDFKSVTTSRDVYTRRNEADVIQASIDDLDSSIGDSD